MVSGLAEKNQTLTATTGTWTGATPITISYQWQRSSDGTTWTAITGATDTSYAVVATDVAFKLRISVSAHNAVGETTAN